MKTTFALTIAFAILLATSGCELAGVHPVNGEPDLLGTTWHLAAFEQDGQVRTVVDDGRSYWIRFQTGGTAAIRADCNTCGAEYARGRGNFLSITPPMCTRMFCGEESFDTPFVEGLRQAEFYRQDGRVLRIFYDDGRRALRLRAE